MTQASPDMAPEAPKPVPKEDIKKMDSESTSSMKEGAPTAGASTDQKRDVASEGGKPNSMIDSRDLDTNMAKEIKDLRVTTPAQGSSAPMPPPQTISTPPPAVNEAIRNSNGKTKVIVRPVLPQ